MTDKGAHIIAAAILVAALMNAMADYGANLRSRSLVTAISGVSSAIRASRMEDTLDTLDDMLEGLHD